MKLKEHILHILFASLDFLRFIMDNFKVDEWKEWDSSL